MVDSMFHLRRIHFQSYVTAAAAASCKPESKGKTAAKTPPSDQQQLEAINDKTEPTKNPELRNNSTFILLDKVTKIGRNPELVDVVLNSIMHSNMISRDHSELVGELDENQLYKYSICDKSLNGTYVNDTRVTGAVLLQEGDIIKFGHVNGAAIKPGEYAPQQTAEFIFRFERAIPGHKYFGYTIKGIRLHPEKTRAYMQISSDRVAPHEAFPATVTKVLPQATIASANATVAAVVSLPASTSTPISCSSASTTSGLNSLMSGLSSNSLQTNHHSGLMQQHQHAAAASALAAAANLSADDVAAVSAHLRTVAAADALNSWNSSLYQLTRLHQQNPHLYGSAFPAAAAAAAAYFQGAAGAPAAAALWPNVAQWRAALGQGAATASNTPTDWVQFNQQKAAVAAAYGLANSSANSLQQHLRLPYSQPLQQNTSGLPAPMPLGPQVTSNANCLPTSSNSGFLPQILSPCAMGVVGSSAGGGYGGVINSADATSSMGSSMYSTSFGCSPAASNSNSAYSSCTSAAGTMKPAQQNQQQQRESPSISAKLAAAAASATKEELEAATRAAAAWPSIPPCSSASSTSARTQLPPSLASVLPAALAARQAGVPLSYMANPSSLSIGQRIPIATALAAVSSNTINGGPVPTSVNNQTTPTSKLPTPTTSQQLDWRSSAAAAAFLGNEERRLLGSPPIATNLGTPPPLPIKLEQRSRHSSTSLSSISSHSTFTNRGPANNLAQSPNQPEVSTEDLMSKASCSSVTEPTPTATTINSLAAAIFDHEGGVGASKGSRKVAQVAPLTPQKPPVNKKSLKRTKTVDLDPAKAELNGGDELKQLQLAAVQAASLASEVLLERPAFVRTPDAAGEEVLPPSSIVVKMMECDSSVPSPPKFGLLGNVGTTSHNGQHNNGNASDSVASNPSRPCSYQSSIPLSPPRAPCPQTRKSPESASRSPLPEPKKYSSSNDSRSSWNKREEKEDLTSNRVTKKKKKKEAKNNNQDDEEEEEDGSSKGEKPKPIKHTRKSNEVARLLNDLTAGNCSWQHQAERTIRTSSKHCNGDSAQPDLPNGNLLGSADRKKRTLRLEERKLKEMQKKKQHKMMRQISDESSADSDADNSQKKKLAFISSVKPSSASSNDSDSETSSVKNHRSNLLSSAPTPIKSKRLAAINGTDSATPVLKSDLLVKQRLTSMDTNELKNSVSGNISSNSTKSSKTSTQEKRRMLKESAKEENISKSSPRSKSKSNSISSSISKKSDKLSTSSSRPPKRKSSSKSRKKGSDSDSDSDINSLTGYTENQSTATMKPPASKRSNGSNGSNSKNNSLNTSSSSIKKRNGGASKVSFSAKEKGQKSKEGMEGDEWFLYHDPDRDLCAHKACQRPQQLSINWVQCDDCDSWYHSLCALGTNTELEGDADFHCGCTLKKK